MKKVNEKYNQVKELHEKLNNYYEFKRLLERDNFEKVEHLECTLITERETMKSIKLMPDDSDGLLYIVNENIKILEQTFNEQVKNIMGDDK